MAPPFRYIYPLKTSKNQFIGRKVENLSFLRTSVFALESRGLRVLACPMRGVNLGSKRGIGRQSPQCGVDCLAYANIEFTVFNS
jgi:hypothetical protein